MMRGEGAHRLAAIAALEFFIALEQQIADAVTHRGGIIDDEQLHAFGQTAVFSSIEQDTTVKNCPAAVCGKTLLFEVVVNH